MQVMLTVAGFDPSSGAGISADLQVFAAHGLFGTACITALTVQSTRGVRAVHSVTESLAASLAELVEDMPPAGVKIGMLADRRGVLAAADFVRLLPTGVPVVLDPVLRASSGAELLNADAMDALRSHLLPKVLWITPNHAELMALAGKQASSPVDAAMLDLQRDYPRLHIVATGGEDDPPVDRLLVPDGKIEVFAGEHVTTRSTHGTGCAFSSALLSRLVLGDAPGAAVVSAKRYVEEALRLAPGLGNGRGPLHLLWPLQRS